MDSQTFGVTFLFTAAGSTIDLFWVSVFSRTELLEPYRYLSRARVSSAADLIQPRSSNVFSGLTRAAIRGNLFASAVAFAGILSKVLPVFLANIPFRHTLTWMTYISCTWASVAIFGVMILVLLVSLWVKGPYLPADPSTIAGCMYYVCDSRIITDVKGVTDLEARTKDRRIWNTKVRYQFGKMIGVSGRVRIGIDYIKTCK